VGTFSSEPLPSTNLHDHIDHSSIPCSLSFRKTIDLEQPNLSPVNNSKQSTMKAESKKKTQEAPTRNEQKITAYFRPKQTKTKPQRLGQLAQRPESRPIKVKNLIL
jgi:hypothetical protein